MDEEELCYRFYKRLKLSSCPDGVVAAASLRSYQEVNGRLQKLHAEHLSRKPLSDAVLPDQQYSPACSSTLGTGAQVMPTTCFCITDVVQCGHELGGSCLQCSGRLVQNIPLPVYSMFCRAYSALPTWALAGSQRCSLSTSSSSSSVSLPAWEAVELAFPAFVALAASLAPEPGERFLHLGSGAGHAVMAWPLLFPHSAASGVEGCFVLHSVALTAAARLDPDAQRRINLHHCDPFAVQDDWLQANVILVSAAGFDDDAMRRVVDGLHGVGVGTRIVTLSRPLCNVASHLPRRFDLVRQVAFRTTGLGNSTAFVYHKLAP